MARKLFLALMTLLALFLVGSLLPHADATNKGTLKLADTCCKGCSYASGCCW